jgi:hypothetical protein
MRTEEEIRATLERFAAYYMRHRKCCLKRPLRIALKGMLAALDWAAGHDDNPCGAFLEEMRKAQREGEERN